MAWSGSPIAVSPAPSPLISRSSSYWAGSMSWYSSTLIRGQRARSPAAASGSSRSTAAASSTRPSKSTRSRSASALRSAGSASAISLRPSRPDPATSVATCSAVASSATLNRGESPAASWCSRRIRRPRPWNVVTAGWPSEQRAASRSCISWGARRESATPLRRGAAGGAWNPGPFGTLVFDAGQAEQGHLVQLVRLEQADRAVLAVVARVPDDLAAAQPGDGLAEQRPAHPAYIVDRDVAQDTQLGSERGDQPPDLAVHLLA